MTRTGSVERPMDASRLRTLVGDLTQVASVRRIVLDDGQERGVRALAFSTGGGLDFWAMVDRSLDIGPLWWRGIQVAWHGPNGFRSPMLHDPESEGGQGFTRGFSGLLVTCGLDHIRQPAGGHPLHGRVPMTPARLLAYGEDWDRSDPVLFCEGEVTQARLGGERLRLRRRIEAPVGGNCVTIRDRVQNLGAESQEHAILYHFNLGYPLLAEGTEVRLDGRPMLGPLSVPQPDGSPSVTCCPAGQADTASCEVRTPGPAGPLRFAVSFEPATLPYLQLWIDPRPCTNVLGVEPCTSERRSDGTSGEEPIIAPGAARLYRLTLSLGGEA